MADFTFNLPFCLHLPDGDYTVELPDTDPIVLRLKKIIPQRYDERWGIRGLTEQDLKNVSKLRIFNYESKRDWNFKAIDVNEIPEIKDFCEVVSFEDATGNDWFADSGNTSGTTTTPWEKIFLNAEIDRDRLGRLRYTRITAISNSSGSTKRGIVFAVNKLIDSYRIVSGEDWLYRIREDDILFFYSQNQSGYEGFSNARKDISNESIDKMKDILTDKKPISLYDLLALDIKTALYEENYPSAILYTFIYLESALKVSINMLVDKNVISKRTAERMQNLRLYQLVTVGLRLLLNKEELPDQLVEEFSKVNRMRNEIIHNAEMNIRRDDAAKAERVVQQIIDALVYKIEQ